MMESTSFRRERIEKLLHELRYEVERGLMDREIDESMGFRFYFPISQSIPGGVVFGEFRLRPIPRHTMDPDDVSRPRLRIVGDPAG